MSAKDKTQEKLIASMRKTKHDVKDVSAQEVPKVKAEPASKATKKTPSAPAATVSRQTSYDGFQSSERVWPD